jgi:hypothetical protein
MLNIARRYEAYECIEPGTGGRGLNLAAQIP